MRLHLVALGAVVGAPARFLVDALLARALGRGVPWGTLLVNLVGSGLLGLLVGAAVSGSTLALLGTGFCGALTTASTFAWELVELPRRRAVAYAVVSLAGGVLLAYGGYLLGR